MTRSITYTSLTFGIVIWALFGGALSIAMAWWLYQDYLFAYHSQPATAIVEKKYFTVSQGRHGNTHTLHLVYRYQVGAFSAEGQANVAWQTYSSVSPGESIPILYLTSQVGRNRIELPAEQRRVVVATWFLVVFTLLVHIAGTLILTHYVRRNKLYRYLRTNGLSCLGTVTEVKSNLVGKTQTKMYYLTFSFRDNQGRERTGTTGYLKRGDEYFWHEGRPLEVCYDPANSERYTISLNSGPSKT